MNGPFFVYVLASKRNGTLYIGVTNNRARRLAEHKGKLVPGFTRQYGVDQLVYFEVFDSILEARAREHSLKRWRRAWKIALIEKLNPDWRDLTSELIHDPCPRTRCSASWRCTASGARDMTSPGNCISDQRKREGLRSPPSFVPIFSRRGPG